MIDIYYYDKGVQKGTIEELPKLLKKRLWIDAIHLTKEESKLLRTLFEIHPLTVEDIKTPQTRIKVEEFPHYLFCVFFGVKKVKAEYLEDSLELVELDFIIGKNFLISNHKKEIVSTNDLKSDAARLDKVFQKGPDFIFHRLIDKEVDNFFPILDELEDQIEEIEDHVLDVASVKSLEKILSLKRLVRLLKRKIAAQRDHLGYLSKTDYKFISKKVIPYFRDIYDHSVRIADSLESSRDALSNSYDVYMSTLTHQMNEIMKVLSIFAAIALPLTVISGIYGTNFVHLPGAGVSFGFWIMIGLMFSMCMGMLWYFKRKGWFK